MADMKERFALMEGDQVEYRVGKCESLGVRIWWVQGGNCKKITQTVRGTVL